MKKIPEKLKHLDFHKLYLYSKFWLSFYTVAKYERGSWTEKLFEKEEAELALKHVRRCYEGANQLKNGTFMVRKMAQETLKKFEEENKENNFKRAEIGSIPEDWDVAKYISKLKELKPALRGRFKVPKIGIFGSFARNEQGKGSDLDILVIFEEPLGLKLFDLFLEEELGRKVDVVTPDAISLYIKLYIGVILI